MGQKIDGYYVSRTEADYTIYFFTPQDFMESKEYGKFEYDLTMLRGEAHDTARMNFSYYADEPTKIDSIRIESRRVTIASRCEKLYIEPEKESWVHRYSFVVPIEEYYPFYDAASPAQITLYGNGKELMRYEANRREWEKYSPIGTKILGLIRMQ